MNKITADISFCLARRVAQKAYKYNSAGYISLG